MARAINAIVEPYFQHKAVALKDKFPVNTNDEDWITKLATEGDWCFITNDHRISRSKAEKLAFKRANLTGFVLSRGLAKLSVIQQTARLLMQWDLIETQFKIAAGGSMFEIPMKGRKLRPLPV